jgi:hypothetical protein
MTAKSKKIYFLISAVISLILVKQTFAQVPLYRFSYKSDFGVPIVLGSKAYKGTFGGIIDVNMSLNIHSKAGITFGVGGNYLQTKLGNNRNTSITNFSAKNNILTPFVTIGYESFDGGKSRAGIYAGFGYGYGSFNRSFAPDSTINKPNLNNSFSTILIGTYVKLFTDESLSFTLKLDYKAQLYSFNPYYYSYDIAANTLTKADIGKLNSVVSIGLGFALHFKELKTIKGNEK